MVRNLFTLLGVLSFCYLVLHEYAPGLHERMGIPYTVADVPSRGNSCFVDMQDGRWIDCDTVDAWLYAKKVHWTRAKAALELTHDEMRDLANR